MGRNGRIAILCALCFAVWNLRICEAGESGETEVEELRWDEAARQVDSFPFSEGFIDSVRSHHKVSYTPGNPLRLISQGPFCAPETLVYKVSWGPFNAGYVVLATLYDSIGGVVRVGGKALSNNFISAFYRMRDYAVSTIDVKGSYPVFFEQHLREGKRFRADEYILFDPSAGKVHVQKRKTFKVVETTPFIHDYLSVLYFIRSGRSLTPGDTFTERIFVSSREYPMVFSVHESEVREVDAGRFPVILLTPRLVGEGRAFNKHDKLEIWISNDRRRLPVVIRSKIKFGSINARLIWYNGALSTPQDAAHHERGRGD